MPKLSTKNGLIYTYARPPDDAAQGYYWTAIDWSNGKTVWSKYAGSGLCFNNNYAGLALGPDGTAYLGRHRRDHLAARRRLSSREEGRARLNRG